MTLAERRGLHGGGGWRVRRGPLGLALALGLVLGAAACGDEEARDVPTDPATHLAQTLEQLEDARRTDERVEAAYELGFLGGAAAVEALRRAVQDEDPEVAEAAILALEDLGTDEAARALGAIFERRGEDAVFLERRAIESLSMLDTPEAGRVLGRALADPEAEIRAAAAEALALRLEPDAVPALRDAWRTESDPEARAVMADALRELGAEPDPDSAAAAAEGPPA